MAQIAIFKLRKYYYSQIDESDLGVVDDVNRLIDLIDMHRKLKREVDKIGVLTTTENGSQSFTKTNDGIVKINDLNKSIINLKNEIPWIQPELKDENEPSIEELIDD